MGDYSQTPQPQPSQGFDWSSLLQQLSPASLIGSILRYAVPGASGLMNQVANDQEIRADQARAWRTYLATSAPYQAALASGANPSNGGLGWLSASPFSIFPEAPGGPGPNLPPMLQQSLGMQFAPGPQRDAYMYGPGGTADKPTSGLALYHTPGMIPQNTPIPVMTEPLARSWLLQTQAQQGGFAPFPFGPGGEGTGTPGGIPLSGWTWDPKTGLHFTGQTEHIPEEPKPAPFPGSGGTAPPARGLNRQGGTTRLLTSQDQGNIDLPAAYNATTGVNFPGGRLNQSTGMVDGKDGQTWQLNGDGTVTPARTQPGAQPATTVTPTTTPPPTTGTPPSTAPTSTLPAPQPGAGEPGAVPAAPSPADLDAARQRLQQKYGSPRTGQPSPAFTPTGEAAGSQVGMALAPPPGTAPGAETPSLPSRVLSALGPSEAAAQSFMPAPGPGAKPAAQPAQQAPGQPTTKSSTGGVIPQNAPEARADFDRISNAAVANYNGLGDDLRKRYGVTDLNQIKPADIVADKYAVAVGDMYARQLHDDEILRRGQMTNQARVEADRERVKDMYNVIHAHYSQVLGYVKDPKTGELHAVTAMDASSPSFLWSALTPEHAAQPGYLRTLIEKASPRGDVPPYGANYLKQNDPGPAGAAAGRMLASDSLAISVARAFGTSGRINQTELNIIMNKILPNANNTYIGNVHALESLEGNLKALASGASVGDMRSAVGLPPLNAQGEASY